MVRIIATFEKSGVKLRCFTTERKSVLVRIIGRFEKPRFRESWINSLACSAPCMAPHF